MTMYYKDGGFYAEPQESAVAITNELYESLIIGQSEGKQIVEDKDGLPMLADPKPSQFHTWNGLEWVIPLEQQAVKKVEDIAKMREQINALRDKKSAGGVYVEQLDKWFDTDDKSKQKLLLLKDTIDVIGSVKWTCADNTEIDTFDKSKLMLVLVVIQAMENHNHTVAKAHKTQLEQAENPLSYDYSSGWTKSYSDYIGENVK